MSIRIKPITYPLPKEIKDDKGIYLLLSKHMKFIYIGQTCNLKQRLLAHLAPSNSRYDPKEALKYKKKFIKYEYNSPLPLGVVEFYIFIPIRDQLLRKMMENLLIYCFKPKYNKFEVVK